jgi:hypothetical protein
VQIPETTQTWERQHLGSEGQIMTAAMGARLSFPANVDEEELISTVQDQLLEPRPRFSFRASLVSNGLRSVIGFAFLTGGLFSLAWFLRTAQRAKRGDAQPVG